MTKREERRERIERRCEFLEERIAQGGVFQEGRGHDKAELSALRWILEREARLFGLEK